MNETLIRLWNEVVSPKDVIYHLGDFGFGSVSKLRKIISSLNGKKFLCVGSHDKKIHGVSDLFEDIQESFLVTVNGKEQKVFMSHYLHKIWPLSHYGTWHLYSHSHGQLNSYAMQEGKILDVGVDSHNMIYGDYKPFSVIEIIEQMGNRPSNFNSLERPKR